VRKMTSTERTRHVLDRISTGEFPLSVYGRSHARVMPLIKHIVNRRLGIAGAVPPWIGCYRHAVSEMVKAYRKSTAEPLAHALQLVVRKWTAFRLDPEVLQDLACDLYEKFDAVGHQIPKPKGVVRLSKTGPKPRRVPKRDYRTALEKGLTPRRAALTIEKQAALHRQAIEVNKEVSRRLAAVLKSRGVPGRDFMRYNAFAQVVARRARNYTGPSLARAVSDLVDLYEAKSLDRPTLLAICADLFGQTDLPA
jgi:hypothetical protein